MPEFLVTAPYGLQEFLETGGDVLLIIMGAAFVLWIFILERLFYWLAPGGHAALAKKAVETWKGRTDHSSQEAHYIREMLISRVRQGAEQNVSLVKTLTAVAPLMGLLGTVTGMVEVFDVMAITGSSSARAMSAGVSKATIPTMAGMVIALSGLLFTGVLDRWAVTRVQKVADEMELR